MKILYHQRIGAKGGQYVHIEEMVDALRAEGHDVRIVGPDGFEQREFGGESGLILIEDAPLRARLGEAARASLIERDLSWAANARRVASIGRQLVAGACVA